MTTKEIQLVIGKRQVDKGHSPVIENIALPAMFEMDVMSISGAGYMYEFEVKISRGDYKKDSDKRTKHTLLELGVVGKIPNYFYYVCPIGLIKATEIPKYAGLIYVSPIGAEEIVKATLLHPTKHDITKILKKVANVYSERTFLGGCKMTVKNNTIKQNNIAKLESLGFEGELLNNALKIKR